MKENKQLPDIGEMIKITARHCSEKVQPRVVLNGYYVVTDYDKTPRGVQVLIVKPITDDTMKLRVNAERFTWCVANYYQDGRKKLIEQQEQQRQEHPEDFDFWTQMHYYFDKKTVTRIKYMPYIYVFFTLHYLEICVAEAIRLGIDYRKESNCLKDARKVAENNMIKNIGTADMHKLEQLTYEHLKDLPETNMWWQVNSEIKRVTPDAENIDVKTWAVLASLFVDVLFKTEKISELDVKDKTTGKLGYGAKYNLVKMLLATCDVMAKDAKNISFKKLDMSERVIIAKVENIKIEL